MKRGWTNDGETKDEDVSFWVTKRPKSVKIILKKCDRSYYLESNEVGHTATSRSPSRLRPPSGRWAGERMKMAGKRQTLT